MEVSQIRSRRRLLATAPLLLVGAALGMTACGSGAGSEVVTQELAEPLNGATKAKFVISAGYSHLNIDGLTGGEPLLAGGVLEYVEGQAPPARKVVSFLNEASLEMQASSAKPQGLRLPWEACTAATAWSIHLNPDVPSDIKAHSDGGNLRLDLRPLSVTGLSAETGGGNVELTLPREVHDLTVEARSGAGNVTVTVPAGIFARIHATTGLGKVTADPSFRQSDSDTYQSPGYESAAARAEVTLHSGAGDVIISVG